MLLKICDRLCRCAYGGVTVLSCALAVLTGTRPVWPSVVMLLGAFALLLTLRRGLNRTAIVVAALAVLHIGALCNGLFLPDGVNLSHHVTRLLVSAMIVAVHWIVLRRAGVPEADKTRP